MVIAVGFFPGIDDFFVGIAVVAYLDADIRVGVSVVEIAPFFFVEEFDENFFVVPGLCGDVGVVFFVAFKEVVFLILVARLMVEVLDDFDDGFGLFFHVLDVEGYFGADHMF